MCSSSAAASSEIVREFREFERTSTTVLNAYTQPPMASYLCRLEEGLAARQYRGAFTVMQSSGGITSSRMARQGPVRTIQSGPAGGVIGTVQLGRALGLENMVAADVGGTTFDVALIAGGGSLERTRAELGGRPVLQPTIDIASVGAGGGSIAHLDAEGGLKVGPLSAQADPGPACFGLGGHDATVTDAQLVLGYLDAGAYLGERMKLDEAAARQAITERVARPLGLSVEDGAAGILHLTNMNMVYAIRQVTIERGHDPRDFSLVCYGGGGGLFVGALLDELEMRRAIVPVDPAAFSAWGLLNADYREDVSLTYVRPLGQVTPAELAARFEGLEREARTWFDSEHIEAGELELERSAELRYLGQEHAVRIPVTNGDLSGADLSALRGRFDTAYERAYAHSLPSRELEFVNLRLSAFGRTAKPERRELPAAVRPVEAARKGTRQVRIAGSLASSDCPVYLRERLAAGHRIEGPALIEEWNSTILVLAHQHAEVDRFGNLLIERVA
jgi:N-methylhydantoinase A